MIGQGYKKIISLNLITRFF